MRILKNISRFSKKKWVLRTLGLFLFIIVLFKVEPQNSLLILKSTNLYFVLGALVISTCMVLFKSWRWKLLMNRLDINYSWGKTMIARVIGFAGGISTPAQLGEFVKVVYLKNDGNPWASSLLSVLLDRILDLVAYIGFGLLGIFFLSNIAVNPINIPAAILGVMLVIIVLATLIITARMKNDQAFWEKIAYMLMPNKLLNDFSFKFNQIRDQLKTIQKFVLLKAMLLSVIAFFLVFLRGYFLALSIDINMTFITLSACISVVTLVQMIPITIFGIGTRDMTLIYLFPLLGCSSDAAVSFSILILTFVLIHSILGLALWLKYPAIIKK